MAEKTFTMQELEQMAAIVNGGRKDFIPPHGGAGLLRDGSVRPDMASAIPSAAGQWSAVVPPLQPSVYTDQIVEIFTGKTADEGTNPANTCLVPPHPGNLKTCRQTFPFGLYHKGTDTYNIVEANERAHYADLDRRFINSPLLGSPFMPDIVTANPDSINTVFGKMLWEFGHNATMDWTRPAWQGLASRTNAQTHLGWIREFNGLEQQIATGKTDSVTGFACPAADSVVVSYNATIGSDFVAQLSNLVRRLKMDAVLVGMAMTEFHIVVHPRMLFALFDNWACNYMTARCEPDATNGRRVDTSTITRLRDEMYGGSYLLIDGERFPVFTDLGIGLTQNPTTGAFTSDVFVVPVNWAGRSLVYWEYKTFTGTEMNELLSAANSGAFQVINNGLYLVSKIDDRTCISWQFNSKPRMILDFPFLAGRLDDVSVESNVSNQFNSPFTSDPYYEDGGSYAR